MEFTNNTSERIKFCLGYKYDNRWVTVRPGEYKEIEDEERALSHGLVKCEVKAVKSSIGKKQIETKKKAKKLKGKK